MDTHAVLLRTICRLGLAAWTVAFATYGSAQVELKPNLQPFPARDVDLVRNAAGGLDLRFTTTSWNNGAGALELVGGETTTLEDCQLRNDCRQNVYQRVFLSDGSSYLRYAGTFEWHPDHLHFHFNNYASYTLRPVNAPGGSQRTSTKTSFCLLDSYSVDLSLPGAPQTRRYSTCGANTQGISVGWADRYYKTLPGQSFDFTGNPSGDYEITIEVDPLKRLLEGSDADNVSCTRVRVDVSSLSAVVLGSCGAAAGAVVVSAISPSSAPRGSMLVPVTITGSGFTPGVQVSFENGSGGSPPSVSNVVVQSATSITANVTIKSGGPARERYWDVRVGTGVLPRGFKVLP